MKFGKQLQINAVPEWRDYYLSYPVLKRQAYRVAKQQGRHEERMSSVGSVQDIPFPATNDYVRLDDDGEEVDEEDQFFVMLDAELEKISDFYIDKEAELVQAFRIIEQEAVEFQDLPRVEHVHNQDLWKRTLKDNLIKVYTGMHDLRQFRELNFTGFRKILKKHDKVTEKKTKDEYLKKVSRKPYHQSPILDDIARRTEGIMAREFANNDEERAKEILSAGLHEMVVFRRNTIWQDMIVKEKKTQSVSKTDETGFHGFKPIPIILGLLVFFLFVFVPIFHEDSVDAQRCLALLILLIIYWATEAVPLYVTSLMVPFFVVVLGILVDGKDIKNSKEAAEKIASKLMSHVILLIIGGFSIAAALSKYNLDKAFATFVLSKAGVKPSRVMIAIMFVGAFLSMWISNVAAPVLCISCIMPVLKGLPKGCTFRKTILLGIACACNVGGLLTPISSPQNLVGIQQISDTDSGKSISFGLWMVISIPTGIVLVSASFFMIQVFYPIDIQALPPLKRTKEEFKKEHWFIVFIMFVTILLWCLGSTVEPAFGDEGIVSLIPIIAFFGSGLLRKDDFNSLPWNVVFLVAGGSALGEAVKQSELLSKMVTEIQSSIEEQGPWVALLIFVLILSVVTSFISHTVGAMIVLPIVAEIGQEMNELQLLVMGATFMCSGAMALPISSFPNVAVVSTEDELGGTYVKTTDIIKVGIPMTFVNVVGIMSVGYGLMYAIF